MARVAGPGSGVVPERVRAEPPRAGDVYDPRPVQVERVAAGDIRDLPADEQHKVKECLERIERGEETLEAKTRDPLDECFSADVTDTLRVLLYLHVDGSWRVFYVGHHDYEEAERRMARIASVRTLYHGTVAEFAKLIDVGGIRANDIGMVYCTEIEERAEMWARRRAEAYNDAPMLIEFVGDEENVSTAARAGDFAHWGDVPVASVTNIYEVEMEGPTFAARSDTRDVICSRCSVRLSNVDPNLPPVCDRCYSLRMAGDYWPGPYGWGYQYDQDYGQVSYTAPGTDCHGAIEPEGDTSAVPFVPLSTWRWRVNGYPDSDKDKPRWEKEWVTLVEGVANSEEEARAFVEAEFDRRIALGGRIAADRSALDALTTCNSCDGAPMAPGQEAPDQPGYCAACLAEVSPIGKQTGVRTAAEEDYLYLSVTYYRDGETEDEDDDGSEDFVYETEEEIQGIIGSLGTVEEAYVSDVSGHGERIHTEYVVKTTDKAALQAILRANGYDEEHGSGQSFHDEGSGPL